MGLVVETFLLQYCYLDPPDLSVATGAFLLSIVRSLTAPIALRFLAVPTWHRTVHLLGGMHGWLMFPAVSSLGRPLEPIIGICALLLSDFVGYRLELRSRRAFLQRAARVV